MLQAVNDLCYYCLNMNFYVIAKVVCDAFQVEEATKALEATNGTALEKNGQILRVAYAKSVLRPGSGASASSQPSSLAAAAIEAAAFAQQVNSVLLAIF